MMNHSDVVPVLALLLAVSAASGQDAYKCSLPDRRVRYQSQPCQTGKQVVIKTPERQDARPPPPISTVELPRSEADWKRDARPNDNFPLTLRGRSQPVALMLANIAGIYGRALDIDPTIDAVGDFDYSGAALPTALADIGARFSLQIDLKPGLIAVRRR